MVFKETKLKDAYIIELEPIEDNRGFFARTWCQREFRAHGLEVNLVQCSLSYNKEKGTLRGMHYQAPPYEEVRLVRCTRGAIYDVIIDLRPDSHTFKQWTGVELTAGNYHSLYVPKGFAHGFLTLEDHTEVFYQMSQFYSAESARGIRWNDPAFEILWPADIQVISDRDLGYPDFVP